MTSTEYSFGNLRNRNKIDLNCWEESHKETRYKTGGTTSIVLAMKSLLWCRREPRLEIFFVLNPIFKISTHRHGLLLQ